jgi:hypothetical protein
MWYACDYLSSEFERFLVISLLRSVWSGNVARFPVFRSHHLPEDGLLLLLSYTCMCLCVWVCVCVCVCVFALSPGHNFVTCALGVYLWLQHGRVFRGQSRVRQLASFYECNARDDVML